MRSTIMVSGRVMCVLNRLVVEVEEGAFGGSAEVMVRGSEDVKILKLAEGAGLKVVCATCVAFGVWDCDPDCGRGEMDKVLCRGGFRA